MDTTNDTLSQARTELVAAAELFNQVAYIADTLRTMGILIVQAAGDADGSEAGDAVHYGVTVEQLSAQIGAIADHGARLCGDTGSVGDFEQWLLSAAARKALEAVAVERAQPAT